MENFNQAVHAMPGTWNCFALFLTAVFDPSEIIPSVYSRCYGRVGEMEELFHRRFRDGLTQEVVLVHL